MNSMRRSLAVNTVIILSLVALATAAYGDPPQDVSFTLSSVTSKPTRSVDILFTVRADQPFEGFEFSIDFDEQLLQATGIVKRWQRPGETSYDFEVFE